LAVRSPLDKLYKTADLAISRLVLFQQRETALVKDPEELIPFDRLKPLVGLAEVDPEDATAILGRGANPRWQAIAFFDPAPDFIVVSDLSGFAHENLQRANAY
jgi:hypothetical protein